MHSLRSGETVNKVKDERKKLKVGKADKRPLDHQTCQKKVQRLFKDTLDFSTKFKDFSKTFKDKTIGLFYDKTKFKDFQRLSRMRGNPGYADNKSVVFYSS